MALFEYTGLNAKGKKVKGTVNAESSRGARSQLKTEGIFPTSIERSQQQQESKSSKLLLPFQGKVNAQKLGIATRQLATLVGAGIPLIEALQALEEQLEVPALKRVFSEVRDQVNEGSTMADAMQSFPKVFPRLYVNLVASGEASGSLDVVLERLAELLEAQADLRRKITAASAYPVLMLLLCFGVVILLLAFVVPTITEIFADRQASLPFPTQVVITLSEFTKSYWLLMTILGGLGYFAFQRYIKTEKGREKFDAFKLRLPIIGPLTVKVATSRFARTLGTMLTSGIQLLSALKIVRNIVGNAVLEEQVDNAMEGVEEGRGLAQELRRSGLFPPLLIHMIAVGEKTGQLEPMLLRAASSYEAEVDAFISGFTKILEPILILFLAVIVGGILASVMLPMLEMSSLAG